MQLHFFSVLSQWRCRSASQSSSLAHSSPRPPGIFTVNHFTDQGCMNHFKESNEQCLFIFCTKEPLPGRRCGINLPWGKYEVTARLCTSIIPIIACHSYNIKASFSPIWLTYYRNYTVYSNYIQHTYFLYTYKVSRKCLNIDYISEAHGLDGKV